MPTNIDQVTGGVEALLSIGGTAAGAFVDGLNQTPAGVPASTTGEGAIVTRTSAGVYVLHFTLPTAMGGPAGNPAGDGVPEAECIINVTVKGTTPRCVTVTDTSDWLKTIKVFAVDGATPADADIDVEVKRVVRDS